MKRNLLGYEDRKNQKLCILCWIAYASTYICRLNYSAVMPELERLNVFPESQIAAISSAFFICYGLGQIVSGMLGDRLSPCLLIFAGLAVSALSNMAIFLINSFVPFIILWAVNGAVQSLVWTPILRTAGDYFSPYERERFGIHIASTVPLGTLASYGVSLVTLLLLPWKYVFLVCGAISLAASIYWLAGTGPIMTRKNKTRENTAVASEKERTHSAISWKKLMGLMASSGIFILTVSIIIQGTLKDSVTQWIPTFFSQRFTAGTGTSLALTMILPIINVTGAYFARFVNRYLKNELKTSMVFFAVAAVFLAALNFFGGNMILSLISMAGVTNCMFAINVMIITMVPLHFSSYGCVSTVGGILNAVAYIGCGALNMAAGSILQNSSSWSSLFALWLILALTAVIATGAACVPWNKFLRKESRAD